MKRFLLTLLSIITAFSLIGCSDDETSESNSDANLPKYEVNITIDCVPNLIFSKYDCDIFVDDEMIGNLEHGSTDTFTASLISGSHTLRIENEEDSTVDGKIDFEVSKDLSLNYIISLSNDQIEIEVPEEESSETDSDTSDEETDTDKNKTTDNNEKDKDSSKTPASKPKEESKPKPENLTIENNADFATIMSLSDQSDSATIRAYANDNIGKIIEFDGCVFLMMPHENYDTRFDVGLAGCDYTAEKVYGPLFTFMNVNFYDMHVEGTDTVAAEMNFHIVGEIVRYDEEGNTIELKPVSMTAR